MKSSKKIELLSPAGDFECLIAAIKGGADSIYFGLQDFNMRARARNFKITDLPKLKKICNENKIRNYLTLNTIIYDNEVSKLEKLIKKVKPYVDAIICSDIAVIELCKKYKIPFHVSTQMSISNSESAEFFKKLGAERIVLARELNLKQVKRISSIIPVEIFGHGAMCVSVSGRCFTSQFLFNESANRGACIHPCRRSYIVKDNEGNELAIENNYVFSAKDLCTLPFIEQIKKSGITCLKIEGRNKEPEYVYNVTKVYREALDKKLTKEKTNELLDELKKVYNKGFSSGFYLGLPTSDDFSKVENSSAKETKEFLGKIYHYYNNLGVGLIRLNSGKLKKGDELYILGKTSGVIRHKVEQMQVEHKEVVEVKKGDNVGIVLPKCRKGDDVYKIVKKD
jgi:putative protease